MKNLRSRLEKLENYTQKQSMGIPLMFSCAKENRELFINDEEQQSYMNWRLEQVIAERDRVGNQLPIPIFMLVNNDDIKNHIEEFNRYNGGRKRNKIHQAN